MFRIKLVLLVVGGVLAFIGFQEYRVSKGTTMEPAVVDLAAIEAGTADTANTHLLIGEHYPALFELIYWGEENTNKVDYVYYPILSPSHPFVVKVAALFEKYPDGIPDSEVPSIESFTVLVKSSRYKTTDEIPVDFEPVQSIQGLVINKISSLKSEEKSLMQDNFPAFDEDKVLVLEENRKPASAGKKYGMIGGGVLLALLGLLWMFAGGKSGA